jgi:hypothetical protein
LGKRGWEKINLEGIGKRRKYLSVEEGGGWWRNKRRSHWWWFEEHRTSMSNDTVQ